MWNLFKKWYLIRELSKEIARHSIKEDLDFHRKANIVVLRQDFFLLGDGKEYEGVVHRFLNSPWRLRAPSEGEIKKCAHGFNMIINWCMAGSGKKNKEKYIIRDESGMLHLTPLAYDFMGWLPLTEKILSTYKLTWTVILVPILLPKIWPTLEGLILGMAGMFSR